MSNFKSYQNGLSYDLKPHLRSSNIKSLRNIFTLKQPLRCNISVLLLFFFQIISTFLMLVSLSLTVEVISAEEYFMEVMTNNFTNSSGIINNDTVFDNSFVEVLYRSRRLSANKSWILTTDSIDKICNSGYYANRFKSLTKVRMANCDMFDASTVVYPFLFNASDLINVTSDTRFPTYKSSIQVADETILKLPSQLLALTHTGEIRASLKSTQDLIFAQFDTPKDCKSVLTRMVLRDDNVRKAVLNLKNTLTKGHCEVSMKPGRLKSKINCGKCEVAYKNWLCTQYFDMFTPIILPNFKHYNSTPSSWNPTIQSENQSALIGIKSCPAWCSKVETDCVYFTPASGNGGEPAFLCDESHYHHNARYRLSANFDCGADLPWKFCCYSQSLLDQWQDRPVPKDESSCASTQTKCLIKIIRAVYQMKWPPSLIGNVTMNDDNTNGNSTTSNCSHSSSFDVSNLMITILSISSNIVLYFYIDFTIR